MNRNLLGVLLVIGIFTVCGTNAARAQSAPLGKYVLEQTQDNGQTNRIGFELKKNNVAIYSKVNAALEESTEKTGSWKWNTSKALLTVTIPGADGAKGVVVTFKPDGNNLKVVKVVPASGGKVGDIFVKN